jgi:N-acetylglucosaminyldiphosphoundecaprenol N-acetyl-beta-D-mannosaminyltransferase
MNLIFIADTPPPQPLAVRVFDILLALGLLIGLSPLILGLSLYSLLKTGVVFRHQVCVGHDRRGFPRLRFSAAPFGVEWPVLLNILAGQMAFAGPRPLSLTEVADLTPEQEPRLDLLPGLFSPYRLRRQLGIAYEDESAIDLAFFQRQSISRNIGLIVRSLFSRLLAGSADAPVPPVLDLFGVAITNTTLDETLDWMVKRMRAAEPSFVAFMNPDCLNIVYHHDGYREALAQAARILPDGIGIKLACRILGVALKANVNGTDLFPKLCERAVAEGFSLFLLGAKPGVAQAAADNMQQRYPGLAIAGVRDGYFAAEETEAVLAEINASGADALLVAFGAPKQELWLAEHHGRLTPPLRLGVGGLFDFYSGRIPRAPQWMREIGMEWVWRLLQEPGRMWRRYIIGNPLFLYRIWHQRLTRKPS